MKEIPSFAFIQMKNGMKNNLKMNVVMKKTVEKKKTPKDAQCYATTCHHEQRYVQTIFPEIWGIIKISFGKYETGLSPCFHPGTLPWMPFSPSFLLIVES